MIKNFTVLGNRNKLLGFLSIFFPILLTGILHFFELLHPIETLLLDKRQLYSNPENSFSKRLVIVQVDGDSIKKLGWPLPRDKYTGVLELISSGEPNALLFNILFGKAQKCSLQENLELARITSEISNLSHLVHLDNMPDAEEFVSELLLEKLAIPDVEKSNIIKIYNSIELPDTKVLESTHNLHTSQEDLDKDGIVRSYPLLKDYNGKIYPSMAFQAIRMLQGFSKVKYSVDNLSLSFPLGEKKIPLKNGELQLSLYNSNFFKDSSNPQIIPFLKLVEHLEGNIAFDETIFKDKIVLIATTGTGSGDFKNLAFGNVPEVWIHATAISNILEEHYIQEIPVWVSYFLFLCVASISAYLLFFTKRNKLKITVPTILLILIPIFLFYSFQWNISFSISSFLVSGFFYYGFHLSYYIFIEGNEKRQYSKVLSNLIDPFIVNEALNDLESLKTGSEKEITAFFSDIAGFSTISEKLSPKELSIFLNEYLSAMTDVLKHNKGTLDKYIGDAIVGIFGAPVHTDDHYLLATHTSLAMLRELEILKSKWKNENRFFESIWNMNIRIGLNTGIAKVGFMGTEKIASYTMIGDSVNLAARLESAAKDYGVSILISEFTKEKIDKEFFTRYLDRIIVKGKTEPISIYEVIGYQNEVSTSTIEYTRLYESAFYFYQERKWDQAIKRLKEVDKIRQKEDKASVLLAERCKAYKLNPPPKNWDGVFKRENK